MGKNGGISNIKLYVQNAFATYYFDLSEIYSNKCVNKLCLMLNYDLYVHAHIKFCFVYIFPRPTIITMCGENRKFQSWLCLWLHALLCPHTLIANLKFMLHVVTEYNVTTDILWPFYFPSHMIYYINFYVLYHISFFFLCSFFMLWECYVKRRSSTHLRNKQSYSSYSCSCVWTQQFIQSMIKTTMMMIK